MNADCIMLVMLVMLQSKVSWISVWVGMPAVMVVTVAQ
jgi:hypothetical protein